MGTVNVTVNAVNDAPDLVADALTTAEDTAVTIAASALLGNDSDIESDALSIVAVDGNATLNADGTITYTPTANANGSDSFTYTVSDGTDTSTATVDVTVSALNDAPDVVADTLRTNEDSSVTVAASTLLANDSDVEGDAFSITAVSGNATLNADGTITYRPVANANGADSFTYTVSDGADSSVGTVNVTVNAVNDAPVVFADTLSTAEDTQITILAADLLSNDTDIDGDTLQIAGVENTTGGSVVLAADGLRIIFSPAADFSGKAGFDYSVTDGNGGTASGRVTVLVAATNDTPGVNPDTITGTEDNALVISGAYLLANDNDVDGDTLSIVAVGGALGGRVTLNEASQTVSFLPDQNSNRETGTMGFNYTVSDGSGARSSAFVTVELTPVNDAPLVVDDALTTDEDTAATVAASTLLSNDSDVEGDALTITAVSGNAVLNADGTITYTPTANASGLDSFTYTVSDGTDSSTGTVNVAVNAVNDAPDVVADTLTTNEDTSVTVAASALLANDSDVEGDALTITAVSGNAVLNADGSITYTPVANANGVDAFTYTVTDGTDSSTATVNVTVNAVNDAPDVVTDTLITNEDTSVTVAASELLANDSDEEGNALAITAVSGNAVLNADGTITYTPVANANGSDTFTYTVSDGMDSSTGTVNVTVNAVNDAPDVVADTLTTNEDTSVTVAASVLLANDSDIEGDALTITAVDGNAVLNADGTITYTPVANANGSDSFSYIVSDGTDTSTGTVKVSINAINDAPDVVTDALTTNEDAAVTIAASTLLGNDSDAEGDALSITAVSGNAVLNADGTITYTPVANANGSDSFSYTVSDGADSSVGTVNVTVNAVNDAPDVVADSLTTNEDTSVTVAASVLLANDSDIEGDALTITAVDGNAVLNADGTITYTPSSDANGTDSFSYTVSDGTDTSTGTVNVSVNAINDAPDVVTDTLITNEDTALTVAAAVLLANDSDVEGDALTITSVSSNAVLNANGTVSYTPVANFNGTDSFTYTVSDGKDVSTGTANVLVRAVNDAPDVVSDALSTNEDTSVTVAASLLLDNDSDIDGDELTITSVSGNAVLNADRSVTYTPDADASGNDSFTYTLSDGTVSATAAVNVTVHAVNDAPVAIADTLSMNEGAVLTVAINTLLANDYDIDSSGLQITGVSSAVNGRVALSGSQVVFTPTADFYGTASFVYTLSDGALTDDVTVTVNVANVNEAPVAFNDSYSIDEDNTLVINPAALLANDTDADLDALRLVNTSQPQHGVLSTDIHNNLVFTPTANYHGTDQFTYTISDGTDTASATVKLTINSVNDAPLVQNTSRNGSEDTALTFTAAELLARASDIEGDALTLHSVGNAVGGSVSVSGDTVTFQPHANYNGAARFDYSISDGSLTSTATATLNISAVNDAPSVVGETINGGREDRSLTVSAADLLANDSDIDGDGLSIVSVQGADASFGSVNLSGDRQTITYTPRPNINGTTSFTYTVSDGTTSSTGRAAVNIAAVNDAPSLSSISRAGSEDQNVVITVSELVGLGSDIDGDALSLLSVSGAVGGSVSRSGNSVVFSPHANYNGPASFTYSVTDGHGGTASATALLTINAVNDAPVAGADSVSGAREDHALQISTASLLANDGDVDGNTLSITAVHGASSGQVSLSGSTITYTPDRDFHGSASFNYTVSDGYGGTDTGTASFSVASVNDAPIAAGETLAAGTEDHTLTIAASTLLGNDSDVDSNSLSLHSITAASGGSAVISGGNVVFTPGANYNGAASFSYRVSDGSLTSGVATASFNINAVNDAPTISSQPTFSTHATTAATLSFSSLLNGASDVDGDALTISSVSGFRGGVAYISGGNVVFVPAQHHVEYSYRVFIQGEPVEIYIDGDGRSSLGTTYRNGSDDWVVHSGEARFWNHDSSIHYSTDYISGANWSYTPSATGVNQSFSWSGSYGFDYTISDGKGGTVSGTAHVAISGLPSLGRPNPPDNSLPPGHEHYPVALDLDGDGLEFSFANFDWNNDGLLDTGPWVHGDDGFLSIELDGQLQVSANELTFADHHPDALTDMDGIRLVYDSNGNDKLDAGDERYADFRIWQDKNQDGVTDEGELRGLKESGIASIDLTGPLLNEFHLDGQIAVHRKTAYTNSDGSEGLAGDISLLVQLGQQESSAAEAQGSQDLSLSGQLAEAATEDDALAAIHAAAALAVQEATAVIARVQASNASDDADATSDLSLPPDMVVSTASMFDEESAWG